MLHKKARPKRNKSRLIINNTNSNNNYNCKGFGIVNNLYRILLDIKYSKVSKFGKVLAKTIPVLSIFAFLGMMSYMISPYNLRNGIVNNIVDLIRSVLYK